MRSSWLFSPAYLFLLFAIPFGLILVFLVPPLGGGNEEFNFQRTVGIAYGRLLVGPVAVPAGFTDLLASGKTNFHEGAKAPFGYSLQQFHQQAAIPLQAETLKILPPHPIAVLHPLAYFPQALLLRLGALFGLTPLVLFYLARLTGLAVALGFTFMALRLMPSCAYGLCALVLLPPFIFLRSCIDADQLTLSLAVFFIAYTLREAIRPGVITRQAIFYLALSAFVIAQCKSAYLFLPLLVFAIPKARFSSRGARNVALLLIIVPGIVGSVAWMLALKYTYFAGMTYQTWAGHVDPDRQLAFMLSQPSNYLEILLRTVFLTPFIPQVIQGMLGVFGPPVMLAPGINTLLAALLIVVLVIDNSGRVVYPKTLRWLAMGIGLVTPIIILTLLYIQWTGFHAPVIEGFQGRYLYPLAPLFLLFVRPGSGRLFSIPPAGWVAALAGVGFFSATLLILATYFG